MTDGPHHLRVDVPGQAGQVYQAGRDIVFGGGGVVVVFGVVPLGVGDFVVRPELVQALDGAGVAVVSAVHGIGGVGKSQLAVRYFNDRANDYDVAAWVDMRDRQGLTTYEQIATHYQLDPTGDLATQVRDHITRSGQRWLIVFDNCDHPDHVDTLLPRSANAKVIITSRYRHWEDHNTINVDVFDPDTATAYLAHRAQQPADDNTAAVAKALGRLPLALSLAGSYCRRRSIPLITYLEQLGQHVSEGLRSQDPARADHAIRGLWEQSLEAATTLHPDARPTIELLAALDWVAIDRAWLATRRPDHNEDDLYALYDYSLIELTPTHISITHNLITDGINTTTNTANTQQALVAVLRDSITENSIGADQHTAGGHAEALRHLRHTLLNHPYLTTPGLLETHNDAVYQLVAQGTPDLAYAQAVHQHATTHLGPDHPNTLAALNSLATTHRAVGNYHHALQTAETAYNGYLRTYGPDHPDTLGVSGNLALSYTNMGRYDEALELSQATYEGLVRVLGPNHPNTLIARQNLALRFGDTLRYDEALHHALATYETRVKFLGADHPSTLQSRAAHALLLAGAGLQSAALELTELLLQDQLRVLGPDHPDCIQTRGNLAMRCTEAGLHHAALEHDEATYESMVRILGPSHPETLLSRNNLAVSYAYVGRHVEALRHAQATYQDLVEAIGPSHPYTMAAAQNLVLRLTSVGGNFGGPDGEAKDDGVGP